MLCDWNKQHPAVNSGLYVHVGRAQRCMNQNPPLHQGPQLPESFSASQTKSLNPKLPGFVSCILLVEAPTSGVSVQCHQTAGGFQSVEVKKIFGPAPGAKLTAQPQIMHISILKQHCWLKVEGSCPSIYLGNTLLVWSESAKRYANTVLTLLGKDLRLEFPYKGKVAGGVTVGAIVLRVMHVATPPCLDCNFLNMMKENSHAWGKSDKK